MKTLIALSTGLIAASCLAQNSPAPLDDTGQGARPGRRVGVTVLGSTNPYSLGLSNGYPPAGATGSAVRTNTGSGSSRLSSITVTNNGVVTTNYTVLPETGAAEINAAVQTVPAIPVIPGPLRGSAPSL